VACGAGFAQQVTAEKAARTDDQHAHQGSVTVPAANMVVMLTGGTRRS
jgi:hypothetical protein